jgi:predicted transcriptional regulator
MRKSRVFSSELGYTVTSLVTDTIFPVSPLISAFHLVGNNCTSDADPLDSPDSGVVAMHVAEARSFRIRVPDHAFALLAGPSYREAMAEAGRIDFDDPASIEEEEGEEALAAIDEGIRDAEAGRIVPAEEVRKRLPRWITASSSRKER